MEDKDVIPRVGKQLWSTELATSNENRLELLQKIHQEIIENKINIVLAEYEFMLIIDEAITNAMEHGNQWDATKKVFIEIRIFQDNLLLYIRDEGKGFDISTAAEKMSQKFHLSSRGRGIFIISNFSEVQWNNSGNEICIRVKIKDK